LGDLPPTFTPTPEVQNVRTITRPGPGVSVRKRTAISTRLQPTFTHTGLKPDRIKIKNWA
jgi:hypothetical protein